MTFDQYKIEFWQVMKTFYNDKVINCRKTGNKALKSYMDDGLTPKQAADKLSILKGS